MFIFHKIFTIDLSKYAGIFMGIVLNISINLGKTIDSLDLLLLYEDDTSLHLFWLSKIGSERFCNFQCKGLTHN